MEALTPPEGQRVAAKFVACPGLPFPDALAPTSHGGAVERQVMLKMRLPAERLMVRVLQPGGTGLRGEGRLIGGP